MARRIPSIHVDTDMEMATGMLTVMGMVTGAALQPTARQGKDEGLVLQMVPPLLVVA